MSGIKEFKFSPDLIVHNLVLLIYGWETFERFKSIIDDSVLLLEIAEVDDKPSERGSKSAVPDVDLSSERMIREREIFLRAALQLLDGKTPPVIDQPSSGRSKITLSGSDQLQSILNDPKRPLFDRKPVSNEGYLRIGILKKASTSFSPLSMNQIWKPKFALLTHGEFSYEDLEQRGGSYSRSSKKTKAIRLSVDSCYCRAFKLRSPEGERVFELTEFGGPRRLWLAATEGERDAWVAAIRTSMLGWLGDPFSLSPESPPISALFEATANVGGRRPSKAKAAAVAAASGQAENGGYCTPLSTEGAAAVYATDIARYHGVRTAILTAENREDFLDLIERMKSNRTKVSIPIFYIRSLSEMRGSPSSSSPPGMLIQDGVERLRERDTAAEQHKQAWKDMQRDTVSINGLDVNGAEHGADAVLGCFIRELMDAAKALKALRERRDREERATGGGMAIRRTSSGGSDGMGYGSRARAYSTPVGPPSLKYSSQGATATASSFAAVDLTEAVALGHARDMLALSNRTQSGGDAYLCANLLLVPRDKDLCILTPSNVASQPVEITVDIVEARLAGELGAALNAMGKRLGAGAGAAMLSADYATAADFIEQAGRDPSLLTRQSSRDDDFNSSSHPDDEQNRRASYAADEEDVYRPQPQYTQQQRQQHQQQLSAGCHYRTISEDAGTDVFSMPLSLMGEPSLSATAPSSATINMSHPPYGATATSSRQQPPSHPHFDAGATSSHAIDSKRMYSRSAIGKSSRLSSTANRNGTYSEGGPTVSSDRTQRPQYVAPAPDSISPSQYTQPMGRSHSISNSNSNSNSNSSSNSIRNITTNNLPRDQYRRDDQHYSTSKIASSEAAKSECSSSNRSDRPLAPGRGRPQQIVFDLDADGAVSLHSMAPSPSPTSSADQQDPLSPDHTAGTGTGARTMEKRGSGDSSGSDSSSSKKSTIRSAARGLEYYVSTSSAVASASASAAASQRATPEPELEPKLPWTPEPVAFSSSLQRPTALKEPYPIITNNLSSSVEVRGAADLVPSYINVPPMSPDEASTFSDLTAESRWSLLRRQQAMYGNFDPAEPLPSGRDRRASTSAKLNEMIDKMSHHGHGHGHGPGSRSSGDDGGTPSRPDSGSFDGCSLGTEEKSSSVSSHSFLRRFAKLVTPLKGKHRRVDTSGVATPPSEFTVGAADEASQQAEQQPLLVPQLCLRVSVRSVSHFRLCDPNPQEEGDATWATVLATFQQTFLLIDTSTGTGNSTGTGSATKDPQSELIVSDRLVTVTVDGLTNRDS